LWKSLWINFNPPTEKKEKVFSRKGIFGFLTGCGKLYGKDPVKWACPVEKSPEYP
jgi:hypothetical protein